MIPIMLFLITAVEIVANVEKKDFCESLTCEGSDAVCGIREEHQGARLRLFDSECELLKYGCKVEEKLTYGLTDMEYCDQSFENVGQTSEEVTPTNCAEFDCSYPTDAKEVCGIKKDGEGYRVRLFDNKCLLWKHNCEYKAEFSESEIHICNGMKGEITAEEPNNNDRTVINKMDKLVIVDSPMINFNNYNESIENFFAATHVFELPLQDIGQLFNESGRRRLVKIFGPKKIFKPFAIKPENVSEELYYRPTIASCFHKCPLSCSDHYAPVCGMPGILAREPSVMFKNHCYMDVAQCKMFWEDKSTTSKSSNYMEYQFVFCLGTEMNSLYRFLPLIKTLKHMGRLKKKGHFNYKFKNMRFYNNFLSMARPNYFG